MIHLPRGVDGRMARQLSIGTVNSSGLCRSGFLRGSITAEPQQRTPPRAVALEWSPVPAVGRQTANSRCAGR